MHVRAATTVLLAAAVTMVIAGCGGAAQSGSSGGGPTSSPATGAVTGVLVITDTSHPHAGKAEAGVRVGLYLQPVHAGGPISADPPKPIATVTTGAGGAFRFDGLKPGKRYYVFAVGAHGYSTGHWTLPGHAVRLVACSDCAMPL